MTDTSAAPPTLIRALLAQGFSAQRGVLFPWAAVCFGLGVGLYFVQDSEPLARDFALGFGLAGALWLLLRLGARAWLPLGWAAVMLAAGFATASWRAHAVAAPVLDFRFYGAIEGRVVAIDRSQSDKPRLTLDRVVLDNVAAQDTPERIRVSLHGTQPFLQPRPGMVVMITGHLSPPAGPTEPGGFDFQRMAWFQSLGALGYTRVPALLKEPARLDSPALWIAELRRLISDYLRRGIGGREGPFAAAIVTGDRAGVDPVALEALRASNLAHLLAISGLHVGLLTGAIYWLLRLALALHPRLSNRLHPKRLPAIGALLAAFAYLWISGASIATQRAFIMAAVMLSAICLDRRAISLRSVAIAALIVLALTPEALVSPGFQMSFAATTALVAVFATLRAHRDLDPARRAPKWLRGAVTLLITSAVAGLATAPFGAAHFNQMAHYGLAANLVSVPVMGLIVMPGALLIVALAPLGLDWIGLWIMKAGLWWIIAVAEWVAALPGATSKIIAPPAAVLPLLTLGVMSIILWKGQARWIGLAPALAAALLWGQAERPRVLISDAGTLVGYLTPTGRILNRERGEGFVASSWLENDGDPATQQIAAQRGGLARNSGEIAGEIRLRYDLKLDADSRDLARLCRDTDLVVLPATRRAGAAECLVIDAETTRVSGSIAVTRQKDGRLAVKTARQAQGDRLWNR